MNLALPDTSPLPGEYDLVTCEVCGCAFADSAAGPADYEAYYAAQSKYEDRQTATGGGDTPADARRMSELATQITAGLPRSARFLDAGCGNGGLLQELRKIGYNNLVGIDPSAVCAASVTDSGAIGVHAALPLCDDDRARLGAEPFDLIVFSHVLEHVFDACSVISSVLPCLGQGGRLYIEVPDPARYEVRSFPPLYFFDAEHINHFSRKSLAALSARLNLSVTRDGEKHLELENGSRYPALYAFIARDSAGRIGDAASDDLQESLAAYVDQSLMGVSQLRDRFEMLLAGSTGFVMWGAGSFAQRLVGQPWFPVGMLRGIVDRDSKKHGLQLVGHRIMRPEDGLRALPEGSVVLCVAAIAADQIERDYRALGFAHPFRAL